jgi:hypothetical protein
MSRPILIFFKIIFHRGLLSVSSRREVQGGACVIAGTERMQVGVNGAWKYTIYSKIYEPQQGSERLL